MEKDESFDRLARRSLRAHPPAAGPCLDAETIAALSSGALPADDRAAAEMHLADCDRCLGVLATLAETVPPVAARSTSWFSWRWAVPLATAATALVLVVVLQRDDRQTAYDKLSTTPPAPAAAAAPAPEAGTPADAPRAAEPQAQERSTPSTTPRRRASATPSAKPVEAPQMAPERRDQIAGFAAGRAESAPAAASPRDADRAPVAPAAPPPPAAQPMPAAGAAEATRMFRDEASVVGSPIEIYSPDPAIRWRISGNAVMRSIDSGRTFARQDTGTTSRLLAGTAPSTSVCWLAGANGVVLLTDDGRTWRAVTRPASVDLVGITALDANTASVIAANGRTYRTTDAGRTWVMQENPRPSF